MAPRPPSGPSSSPAANRAPPKGPKAQRQPVASGSFVPGASAGVRVSIPFPASANAVAGPSSQPNGVHIHPVSGHGARQGFVPNHQNVFNQPVHQPLGFGSRQPYQGYGQMQDRPHQLNGARPPAGPSHRHTPSNGSSSRAPVRSAPSSPPPPPADIAPPPPSDSAFDGYPPTPPLPKKRPPSPPSEKRPATPPIESDYKSRFLPTTEATRRPISISLPMLPNGKARPRPPQMDPSAPNGSSARPKEASATKVQEPRGRPPAPPPEEPPLPPPPPSGPLPPDLPPPALPRRRYSRSPDPSLSPTSSRPRLKRPPPPPKVTAPDPPPPSPPRSRIRSPSPVRTARPGAVAPPAIHFRELKRPVTPDSDSESDSEPVDTRALSAKPRYYSRQTSPALAPAPALEAPPERQGRCPSPSLSPPPPPEPKWTMPDCTKDRKVGSFMITPSADGRKGVSQRFDGVVNGVHIKVEDPRRGAAPRPPEPRLFSEIRYEKPPSAPRAVLVTNLDPLTTVDQIRTYFRQHGRVEKMDNKMDTRSGMQLGICWLRFDGPPSGRVKGVPAGEKAHEVAVRVARTCDGKRIGMNASERIKVVLDGRALRAEQAVKDEMAKRYPSKIQPPAPTFSAPPDLLPPFPPGAQAPSPIPPILPPFPPKMAPPAQSSVPPTKSMSTPTSGHATPLLQNGASAERSRPVPVAVPIRGGHYRGLPSRPPSAPVARPSYTPRAGPSMPSVPMPYRNARPPATSYAPSYAPTISRPAATTQQFASSFTDAPFKPKDTYVSGRDRSRFRDRSRGRAHDRGGRQQYSRRRSNSYSTDSHSSDCSTCSSSDSESDRPPYRRRRTPPHKQSVAAAEDKEKVKRTLEENGRPVIFVPDSVIAVNQANEVYLKDHFKAFKPESILRSSSGFYVLFSDSTSARAAEVLNGSQWQGKKFTCTVKSDHVKAVSHATDLSPTAETKSSWKMLTIGKTKRAAPPPVKTAPKPAVVKRPPIDKRKMMYTDSEGESEVEKVKQTKKKLPPSASSESELSEEEAVVLPKSMAKRPREVVAPEECTPARSPDPEPLSVKEVVPEAPVQAGKKRPAPAKASKKGKKARVASPAPLVEPVPPEVAEITIPAPKKAPAKKAVKPKAPTGPLAKLIAEGEIEDEEDAYWLSQALAGAPEPPETEDEDDEDELLLPEEHPLYHVSGSWRAQGVRKVPHALKSAYLPQRNRAQAAAEATAEQGHGLTTGRTARVTGRRLAHDMETHRKITTATAESDLFAFNQLRIRKKQLRFARSAIEGYGLYAMETIQPGEMVCEYVGELIRSVVADLREAKYTKQGIGSSYLFRIDGDVVCDATFRGSVSRLINHSCDPSASAKIISINGQSKIVIYAKRQLSPGEEILYDYKFPLESDPALRVPCLCGSKICRGFLN